MYNSPLGTNLLEEVFHCESQYLFGNRDGDILRLGFARRWPFTLIFFTSNLRLGYVGANSLLVIRASCLGPWLDLRVSASMQLATSSKFMSPTISWHISFHVQSF